MGRAAKAGVGVSELYGGLPKSRTPSLKATAGFPDGGEPGFGAGIAPSAFWAVSGSWTHNTFSSRGITSGKQKQGKFGGHGSGERSGFAFCDQT